jgi:hypothetical protein
VVRDDLVAQLGELARRGVTPEALRSFPQLVNLAAVRDAVGPAGTEADRRRRFEDVLRARVAGMAAERDVDADVRSHVERVQSALTKYFGLEVGLRRAAFARRRRAAAGALGLSSVASFRDKRLVGGSHEQRLLETALEILDAAAPHPGDASKSRLAHPSRSALELQWRYRFEHYSRMSTRLRESAAYLEAFLQMRADGQPRARFDPYALYALWAYTKFGRAAQLFIDELGGGWAFSSAQAEVDADEAVRTCTLTTPLTWEDDSYLRVALGDAREEELSPFADWLRRAPRACSLLEEWRGWIERCACPTGNPTVACRPHTFIENAEAFLLIVHSEWPRIADWYADGAAQWRLDPAELARRFQPPDAANDAD